MGEDHTAQPRSETTSESVDALLEIIECAAADYKMVIEKYVISFFFYVFVCVALFIDQAARYDDIDDVVSIASSGISLDSKDSEGRTALHMAAANGHLTIVDYLISNGVDVNAINMEKNTPLHWACLNGQVEVVKRLVLAGASVSSLNSHERTPMDEAINRGKMDVVDAINSASAQVELSRTTVS